MARHATSRLYLRVTVVGFWGLLVGAVVVFMAAKLLPATTGEGSGRSRLWTAGLPIASLLVGGLGGLIEAGFVSLGFGAALMAFGVRLFATAA